MGRPDLTGFSQSTLKLMIDYPWPGNVRELENTIERAVLLARGPQVEPKDLPAKVCGLASEPRGPQQLPQGGIDLRSAVDAFENNLIRQALERTSWNKNRAAALLGLNRTTLVEMLKRKRIGSNAA
jgi:DNA-binding NtrC family response regulator